MKTQNLPLIATSAALAFVACSDDASSVTTALQEAQNYAETTTYTCTDGSIVSDATQCPSTTTYTCATGAVVTDAALCPSIIDPTTGTEISGVVDSTVTGGVADSTTTITCADGSTVTDASLCPAVEPASSSTLGRSSSSYGISASVNSSSSAGTPVISVGGDDSDTDLEDAKTLDGSEILLTMSGTSATVQNDNGCITLAEKSVTLTCPADYYFTGTSTDFQIIVNTPGTDGEGNTGIYLYNATVKSSNAPILVVNAEQTVIHIVKGTTNAVEDGSDVHWFTKVDGTQDSATAVIYSKDDLNIKGAGTLTVTANHNNGIVSSNDLKIKNGNITVTAPNNGIKGKGSLHISGGTLNVTATSGDGLKSDECTTEDSEGNCTAITEGKGYVMISGGTTTVKAGDEGIQATNYVFICDSTEEATLNLTTTGKGISSGNLVYVNGGTTTINSSNDGIASDMNIWMNAGYVTISASASTASYASTNYAPGSQNQGGQSTSSTGVAQGIHADSTLYLNGSTVNIVTAVEGIEAYYIRAMAGITSTYGTDDGWNAAGGASNGSSYGGPGGGGSSSAGYIFITGGYHYISASGNDIDVLDANGSATQTGGVLILEIPTSSQGGMSFAPGGNQGGSSWGGSGSGCSTNQSGGLIDTDNGYTITGGVMIGFGSQTEEYPQCSSTSYTSSSYYGSSNAAAKPQGSGSMVIYGGDVSSIAQVETSGMTEVKFPNGVSYMYK